MAKSQGTTGQRPRADGKKDSPEVARARAELLAREGRILASSELTLAEMHRLELRADDAETRLGCVLADKDELKDQLDETRGRNVSLRRQADKADQRVEAAWGAVDRLQLELAQTQGQLDRLRRRTEEAASTAAVSAAVPPAQQTDGKKKQAAAPGPQPDLSALLEELEAARLERDTAQAQVRDLTAENARLRRDLQQATSKAAEADGLRGTVEELERSRDDLGRRLEEVKQQLGAARGAKAASKPNGRQAAPPSLPADRPFVKLYACSPYREVPLLDGASGSVFSFDLKTFPGVVGDAVQQLQARWAVGDSSYKTVADSMHVPRLSVGGTRGLLVYHQGEIAALLVEDGNTVIPIKDLLPAEAPSG